jgi:arylformamidase
VSIIDISPVVDSSIAVWPGDRPYARNVSLDMANGANLTLSDVTTTLHVGAHADAPSHYSATGEDIGARSLHYYLGTCVVWHVGIERGQRIYPEHVAGKPLKATRVLIRTDTFPDPRNWNEDFASLSSELVDSLHARGVITIGLDTPSVDLFDDKVLEAHQALARHDMANLEGLVLGRVAEGLYELIALPLRLAGADGSPVRAVLRPL